MSNIIILKNGITDFETECIVNAANSDLLFGGGVCGAIFKAAGVKELSYACNAIGHCHTGDAVITPAFGLVRNKYIIHAVGPEYSPDNKQKCRDQLFSAYRRSLELMLENGCKSIAFPLISSGIYGYPMEEAWRIAIKACNTFINQHPNDEISIFFAVIHDDTLDLGNEILRDVLK
jgi:O-acetyl-ADP-ribose deacetylase (regulator of RNase III)